MRIVLVGFLPDGHGRSCVEHPYGCGNALIERPDNGVGTVVRLRLVELTNLACHARVADRCVRPSDFVNRKTDNSFARGVLFLKDGSRRDASRSTILFVT